MTNRKNTSKRTVKAPVATATFNLTSPKGKAYSVSSDDLASFAKRFNLDASALRKVARGERGQHKNWVRGA